MYTGLNLLLFLFHAQHEQMSKCSIDFVSIFFYTHSMSIHPMSERDIDKNCASSSQQRKFAALGITQSHRILSILFYLLILLI